MYVMDLFDNKTMDMVVSYLLGATVNSNENVTCKVNIFFFQIMNFESFLDKIKSQGISRISKTSGHPELTADFSGSLLVTISHK